MEVLILGVILQYVVSAAVSYRVGTERQIARLLFSCALILNDLPIKTLDTYKIMKNHFPIRQNLPHQRLNFQICSSTMHLPHFLTQDLVLPLLAPLVPEPLPDHERVDLLEPGSPVARFF